MRYKIIDEEVVESLIKFLDEIQFGTAEHGMKRSTVEIVNMCSYFISELLNADEVEHTDIDEEEIKGNVDKIIEFQIGDIPDEDYEKMLKQFDSFFKNFKKEYHKSKSENKSDKKTNLKKFKEELKRDRDLSNKEKFELYYDEYVKNKLTQKSRSLNSMLKEIGLIISKKN